MLEEPSIAEASGTPRERRRDRPDSCRLAAMQRNGEEGQEETDLDAPRYAGLAVRQLRRLKR